MRVIIPCFHHTEETKHVEKTLSAYEVRDIIFYQISNVGPVRDLDGTEYSCIQSGGETYTSPWLPDKIDQEIMLARTLMN